MDKRPRGLGCIESATPAGAFVNGDCEFQIVLLWRARCNGPFPYLEPTWLSPLYCWPQLMCLLFGCITLMSMYCGVELEWIGRLVVLPALGVLGVLCLLEVSLCSFLGRHWQPPAAPRQPARVLIRGTRYQLRSLTSSQASAAKTIWDNVVHPATQRMCGPLLMLLFCPWPLLHGMGFAPSRRVMAVCALTIIMLPFLVAVLWPSSFRLEHGYLMLVKHYPLRVGIRSITRLRLRDTFVFCDLVNLEVQIRRCSGIELVRFYLGGLSYPRAFVRELLRAVGSGEGIGAEAGGTVAALSGHAG